MTGADKERFDAAEILAMIRHRMIESDKFQAEMAKLNAENLKFASEQRKLDAEARKLDRVSAKQAWSERWLAPLIVAGGVGGAVATVISLLLNHAK